MTPNFKGNWLDCLEHLSNILNKKYAKGTREASGARQPIARFCGVDPSTVASWIHSGGKTHPAGLTQLKLMWFLDLQGYVVTELEGLGDTRKFSELVAFGVVEVNAIVTELGYTDPSTFYRVLFGLGQPLSDKADKMYQIWKLHKDELETKKVDAQVHFKMRIFREPRHPAEVGVGSADSTPAVRTENTSTTNGSRRKTEHERSGVIDIMAGLLKLLSLDGAQLIIPNDDQQMVLQLAAQLNKIGARLMAEAAGKGKDDDHE